MGVKCLFLAASFGDDSNALAALATPRTRAIVIVAPNNPTGTLCRQDDARAIEELAALRVRVSHGGWTALLEVPRVIDEDAWVSALALEAGVLVQPGYFYDLADGGTLVLSLIVEEATFGRGVRALVELIESKL